MSDKDYWERHAQHYDTSVRLLARPMARMIELTRAAVEGRSHVLEVAAGTGLVTTVIAPAVGTLIATDYAAAMVALLEKKVCELRLSNVRCEQADLFALPYEPACFDAIVAANVLHLVDDFGAAVAALRRHLAPGGILIAPTFCHDQTVLSAVISRLGTVVGFPVKRRFTTASLQAALERLGARIDHAETIPGPIPIGYVEASFL